MYLPDNLNVSFESAKKSLFRSFNAIYGKIGNRASEETVLELMRAKCLPALLYGLDACPVNAADTRSLEFSYTRLLMKMFKTTSLPIIEECRLTFGIEKLSTIITRRKTNFQ